MSARGSAPARRRPAFLRAILTRFLPLLLVALPAPVPSPAPRAAESVKAQIRFGAEMARQGNWREAIFRWKKALETDPRNPRLHNNLAVAYETQGDFAGAETEYKAALEISPGLKEVRENYALFQNFYDRYRRSDAAHPGPPVEPDSDSSRENR
jgi:Tfp pilus assembly protein PilF